MTETLRRRVGPVLLTGYGVGVMVGAGIYVLLGVVIGTAGIYAPLAFLLAAAVALPSALSYSELSARMPEAAGEAAFIERGFDSTRLAIAAGLAITVAGMISGAAVLRGGVGYLAAFLPWPDEVLIIGVGVLLILVALIGVLESLIFAVILTLVEIAGLMAVSLAGFLATPVADWTAPAAPEWWGIAAAIPLCFFAFIGFEDIENLSEEVREPTRNVPRAILASLAITAAIYALVSVAAVRAVPHAAIAATERPLALVWEHSTGTSALYLSAIAVAAALNGVLAQIVMAARVLFGLGRRATWLAVFTHADARFGTPVAATLLVGGAVIGAALALPVVALAEATAAVLITVFLMVNVALIRIKARAPEAPFRTPVWVPWAGLVAALAALGFTLGAAA